MDTITPFSVDVPESEIDELRQRIAATRWPDQLPGVGWGYGVALDDVRELAEYWRDGYDWRVHERKLNAYPQFTTTIDGQNIHFVHARSPEPDAVPMIITHGWPSTVHDFVDIIGPLTDPRAHGGDPADAFDVVAPSLPGFAYSGPTTATGWGTTRIAAAWAELMSRLGHERYVAQGGDFGSIIAPELGRIVPDRVLGVHVNALATASTAHDPADAEKLTDEERARSEASSAEWMERSGYAMIQSTRPQTLAYGLLDSPAGQLAWNYEWFADYDPAASKTTPIDRDAILTDVSSFWFTRTAGSAARIYRESNAWGAAPQPSGVPTAVANFAGDGAIRGLAELADNVVRWTEYDHGGHFASLQAPDLLVADIREFVRTLR
ncbi:epoxide hydrolase family protein [Pseudonocardia sp. TRM90224]|uniref:epoxide hydrolase family protein n=1 Tax=Pseudonocardia sp. TRM90224 TaxID=2812678 RepID=UPI001E4CDED1|nr:epoxide hydrolase family protein [Pseudonocardia sp. TRM90224]